MFTAHLKQPETLFATWLSVKTAGLPFVFHQNGIVAAQLTVNLPFAIKLTVMAFQEVDHKLESVAGQIDGALASAFLLLLLAALSLFISHLVTRNDWRKQCYGRNH